MLRYEVMNVYVIARNEMILILGEKLELEKYKLECINNDMPSVSLTISIKTTMYLYLDLTTQLSSLMIPNLCIL